MSFFSVFKKNKLSQGLKLSSQKLSQSIKQVFTHKKIDEAFLSDLEEILIESDIGVLTSTKIIDNLRKNKFAKSISEEEIKEFLANIIQDILKKCEKNLDKELEKSQNKTKVIIFNGVNGAGKTTTIGKIAHNLSNKNQKVLISACDTFRAGAADQLEIWAKRSNCQLVKALKDGEDPAAVAFRSLKKAQEENFDYLLIDTAGRLQNKTNLMDELKKINNVLKKINPNVPDINLLILDATTGQNAKSQLKTFDEIINIDGLIITKLDGSAKGGSIVNLCDEFEKPVFAIGVGEKIEDLQQFNSEEFAKNIVDI